MTGPPRPGGLRSRHHRCDCLCRPPRVGGGAASPVPAEAFPLGPLLWTGISWLGNGWVAACGRWSYWSLPGAGRECPGRERAAFRPSALAERLCAPLPGRRSGLCLQQVGRASSPSKPGTACMYPAADPSRRQRGASPSPVVQRRRPTRRNRLSSAVPPGDPNGSTTRRWRPRRSSPAWARVAATGPRARPGRRGTGGQPPRRSRRSARCQWLRRALINSLLLIDDRPLMPT